MAKTEDGLTDKQRKFIEEYLIDLNGTRAAIRAGYSEKTARSIAAENLSKPDIIEALNRRRAELSKTLEVTPERVLKEYARIGFADIRKAVRWKSNVLAAYVDPDSDGEPAGVHVNDVEFIDSDDLDDDTACAIAEVAKDAKGGIRLKFHDKKGSLDSIARHLGMFEGKPPADPGDDQPGVMDDRAAARRVAHMLLRAAGTPAMLPEGS